VGHIKIVDDFHGWSEWYQFNSVEIDDHIKEYNLHQNEGVILQGDGCQDVGIVKDKKIIRIKSYYKPSDIGPKNHEQKIALELLRDETIPLKILSGVAGSGKTLLACAHALEKLKKGDVANILIAKSMVPVGRDIGFLKGSVEEKTTPYLGAFYDNFLQCNIPPYEVEQMIADKVIDITPIAFIQGRSLVNTILIIDEVQNLDIMVIKQLITRAGEGTEVILLGDSTQNFEFRNKDRSIDILLEKGKKSPLVGTVHLVESVRSALSQWAVLNL